MKRLKEIREKRKLSQAELAKLLNISSSTVGMYEQNRRFPKDENMLKSIANFFNVSVDYLLGLTDIPDKIDDYARKNSLPAQPAADQLHLTADERAMLEKYRALPEKEKGKIEGRIEAAYENMQENSRRDEIKGA